MSNLLSLSNLAEIAIAINLAYMNLDTFRYVNRLREFTSKKLDSLSRNKLKSMFDFIEHRLNHPSKDLDDLDSTGHDFVALKYSFLDRMGELSEYRRRLADGSIISPPVSKFNLKANDGNDDSFTKSMLSMSPKSYTSKISTNSIWKFYRRYVQKRDDQFRTRDQMWSVTLFFVSMYILVVSTISDVISDGRMHAPWLKIEVDKGISGNIIYLIFIGCSLSYVIYWLFRQNQIRDADNNHGEGNSSNKFWSHFRFNRHSRFILWVPLATSAFTLFYLYPNSEPFSYIFGWNWGNLMSMPMFLVAILSFAALYPMIMLLQGFQGIPIIEARIDAFLKELVEESIDDPSGDKPTSVPSPSSGGPNPGNLPPPPSPSKPSWSPEKKKLATPKR